MKSDEYYMKEALRLARKAYALDEVPIGCVIVKDDQVIARGYNRRNTDKNVLSHAELSAMKKATRKLGDWRLEDCTLYVTLEPCQMCAGAIVQARVKRVVVGAMNAKAGCAGSVINLLQMRQFNHQVELTTGVLREECSRILSDFFLNLRSRQQEDIIISTADAGLAPQNVVAAKAEKSGHGRRRKGKRMQYKVLLWDIDGTLLDFLAAEKAAMKQCFLHFGMGECTDEMIERYSAINRKYWEALERGEISKPEVLVGRYREFFALEGLDTSLAEAFNSEYQVRLGDTCIFCDDGYHIVEKFIGHAKQYVVTNGTKIAQDRKLNNSGLIHLFDDVFISDVIGFEKPSVEFFDAVFAAMPSDIRKEEILIIGDSLTSDIKGGNNAGIATCWYNPRHQENTRGVHVDYEISDLHQLIPISGIHFKN